MKNNTYNLQHRIDAISPSQWKGAFSELADRLTLKLQGRTRRGPFSKEALGCQAVEYLSKRAYDMLCNGDTYWPPEVELTDQLDYNAMREMKRIESEWHSKAPLSKQQAQRQLEADRRTQSEATDMAYRIAIASVGGNPQLLALLAAMREENDRHAIARRLKLSLAEVAALEAELLRRLRA